MDLHDTRAMGQRRTSRRFDGLVPARFTGILLLPSLRCLGNLPEIKKADRLGDKCFPLRISYVSTETEAFQGATGARTCPLCEVSQERCSVSEMWSEYFGTSRVSKMRFLQGSGVCEYHEAGGNTSKEREEIAFLWSALYFGCFLKYGESAPSTIGGNASAF